MRKLKACGVLVVRGSPIEQFLLMVHPDRLDVPKGILESGESERECALRELREETGVAADDIELDRSFRFSLTYPLRSKRFGGELCEKTLVMFLGQLRREVPIAVTEHESYRWVRWNPPHQIQPETIDPLLQALEDFLSRDLRNQ